MKFLGVKEFLFLEPIKQEEMTRSILALISANMALGDSATLAQRKAGVTVGASLKLVRYCVKQSEETKKLIKAEWLNKSRNRSWHFYAEAK